MDTQARQHVPSVSRYLDDVRGFDRLSPEVEREHGARSLRGERDSRDALVEANLAFVVGVAKRYRHLGVPFEDLLSEGNLGLIEAATRFDPANGTRFLTYASWWVRKAILEHVERSGKLIRTPRPDRDRSEQRFTYVSLNVEPDGKSSLAERLPDGAGRCALGSILDEETRRRLLHELAALPEQERRVLSARFGIEEERPLTLREIGDRMSVSRERIRQIEAQARGRLRRRLQAARSRRKPGAARGVERAPCDEPSRADGEPDRRDADPAASARPRSSAPYALA